MKGDSLFSDSLDLFLHCVVPDYCLVYIVGIRALYSILPGAGAELADPGPPGREGRRGRTPYNQDLEGVDTPAYGATIYVVKVHEQNVLVMS